MQRALAWASSARARRRDASTPVQPPREHGVMDKAPQLAATTGGIPRPEGKMPFPEKELKAV